VYIASVEIHGFRNLDGVYPLDGHVATVVGENNTGKTNLIDAVRLVAVSGSPFDRLSPTLADFRHDPLGQVEADHFTVDLWLEGLTTSQAGRLVSCLAPTRGPSSARLGIACTLGQDGRITTTLRGGDLSEEVEPWARSALRYTFLPALRDAEAELRPGRLNRLAGLLSLLAPADSSDRELVEQIAAEANRLLETVPAVQTANQLITQRLDRMLKSVFQKKTSIVFANPRFEQVVAGLRALLGQETPVDLSESGLGYNNLLFMAVLLSTLQTEPEVTEHHLLLVEEPEAHLHPQLQDLLMDFMDTSAGDRVQAVVTTHSPTFTSGIGVDRITVLTVDPELRTSTAVRLSDAGLTDEELDHLARFLDVTKAQLLFSRGVILVEGVAEQLLVPEIARAMGRDLHEHGVTVINVEGLAFSPFAHMFGPRGLPRRCAVVSDGDAKGFNEEADEPLEPTQRAAKIAELTDGNIKVVLADRTFEWDLVKAGNWALAVEAMRDHHPQVAAGLEAFNGATPVQQADEFLSRVANRKGRVALAMARRLRRNPQALSVPPYIAEAIRWATTGDAD